MARTMQTVQKQTPKKSPTKSPINKDSAPFPGAAKGFDSALWNDVDRKVWMNLSKEQQQKLSPLFKNKDSPPEGLSKGRLRLFYAYKHFRHFKCQAEQKTRANRKAVESGASSSAASSPASSSKSKAKLRVQAEAHSEDEDEDNDGDMNGDNAERDSGDEGDGEEAEKKGGDDDGDDNDDDSDDDEMGEKEEQSDDDGDEGDADGETIASLKKDNAMMKEAHEKNAKHLAAKRGELAAAKKRIAELEATVAAAAAVAPVPPPSANGTTPKHLADKVTKLRTILSGSLDDLEAALAAYNPPAAATAAPSGGKTSDPQQKAKMDKLLNILEETERKCVALKTQKDAVFNVIAFRCEGKDNNKFQRFLSDYENELAKTKPTGNYAKATVKKSHASATQTNSSAAGSSSESANKVGGEPTVAASPPKTKPATKVGSIVSHTTKGNKVVTSKVVSVEPGGALVVHSTSGEERKERIMPSAIVASPLPPAPAATAAGGKRKAPSLAPSSPPAVATAVMESDNDDDEDKPLTKAKRSAPSSSKTHSLFAEDEDDE